MIFNRLFTPDYASPDESTRRKAVERLSPDKPSDKSHLHELAFNDSSRDVSLAALEKLNSFALWQKMAVTAADPCVQRVSAKKVDAAVQGNSSLALSPQERRAFLLESASRSQIESVLLNDPHLLSDTALCLKLIAKAHSEKLIRYIILRAPDAGLAHKVVAQLNDKSLIQRLIKKVADTGLSDALHARLSVLEEQEQRPLQLTKAVTLVMSKYQALLDNPDEQDVAARAALLENEYAALQSQMGCLTGQECEDIRQKYSRIRARVHQHMTRLTNDNTLTGNDVGTAF
ncbi:hypothetical protein [Alteromonas sp. CYL-A6]|uniref:hypothetical protein n=1 Tax=Alteromonas nitratireducens TaxID=3390813 RepID=UPI0034AC08F2